MHKTGILLFGCYAAAVVSACATHTRESAPADTPALQALEEGKNYLRLAVKASASHDAAGACTYTSKAIDRVTAIDRSALNDDERKIISDTIAFGTTARDQICKAQGGQQARIETSTQRTKEPRRGH